MFKAKGSFQSVLDFILHKEVKRGKGGGGIIPYGSQEAREIIERVRESEKRLAKRYGRTTYQE